MARVTSALDRRRSAAVRAVGRDPYGEFRGARLTSRNQLVDIASPYLTIAAHDSPAVQRGLGDALALLLRHSDQVIHQSMVPDEPLQRVIFDLLEQLRCQALAPPLAGVSRNLEAVSEAWCQNARANGVAESGVGLLVYTLAHMARARLRLGMTDEEIDSIIEAPRARLGRLVGHALRDLSTNVEDQAAYAAAAAEIARLVDELATAAEFADSTAGSARYQMLVPPEWIDFDGDGDGDQNSSGIAITAAIDSSQSLDQLGDYRIYSTAYDTTTDADQLYLHSQLRDTRRDLDELVKAQSVSAHRIALRLRRLFGTQRPDEWRFGEDEGVVDGRRLPQMIANPIERQIFKRQRNVVRSDTVVSLLMDNSGSMKAQRYETLATLADTLSRALDLAGISHEMLGHTTNSWAGGQALEDWKQADRPEDPGRVADLSRIIYKNADTSWKRARLGLAAMHITRHFRESLDGEAIIWAHNRLMSRPEPRKVLVVVSDGAPAEAATNKVNRSRYLADHLARVVDHIERRSPVEIGAITTDNDLSGVFRRSVPVDLDATLSIGAYQLFEELFR